MLSQTQGNRKRRGRSRGRKSTGKGPELFLPQGEDARTFWERSNARLGVEGGTNGNAPRRGRVPVEFACAVCGAMVALERWPKQRLDVRCEPCRLTMSALPVDDEEEGLPPPQREPAPSAGTGRRAQPLEGLPELTPEDLEALAELRGGGAGDGRVGMRRRRGAPEPAPAAAGSRRRRRRTGETTGAPRAAGPSANGNQAPAPRAPAPATDAAGPEAAGTGDDAGAPEGRRRRRRRRGGERKVASAEAPVLSPEA